MHKSKDKNKLESNPNRTVLNINEFEYWVKKDGSIPAMDHGAGLFAEVFRARLQNTVHILIKCAHWRVAEVRPVDAQVVIKANIGEDSRIAPQRFG